MSDIPAPSISHSEPADSTDLRPGLLVADRALAMIVGLLVLVQAALAGHSNRIAGTLDIEIHGVLGNVTFTLVIVGVVIAAIAKRGPARMGVLVVLLLLMVAQTGLGYVGRSTLGAAAWHVPLGVLIFGLTVYNVMSARGAVAPRTAP